MVLCRRRGYHIIQKNRWWKWGEIDLWVRDSQHQYVIVEIRGRRDGTYHSSEMLSGAKVTRLRRLAMAESRRLRKTVRVELLEIVGDPTERFFALKLWIWRALGLPKRFSFLWYRIF